MQNIYLLCNLISMSSQTIRVNASLRLPQNVHKTNADNVRLDPKFEKRKLLLQLTFHLKLYITL